MAVDVPQAVLNDYLMSRSVMDEPRSVTQRVLDMVFGRTYPEQATNALTGGLGSISIGRPAAGMAISPEAAQNILRSVLESNYPGTQSKFFPPAFAHFLKEHPTNVPVHFSEPNLGFSMFQSATPGMYNPLQRTGEMGHSMFGEPGVHIFPETIRRDLVAKQFPSLYQKFALGHELVHATEDLAGSPIPFPGLRPVPEAMKYIGNDPKEWLAWSLYPPRLPPGFSRGGASPYVDIVDLPAHRKAVEDYIKNAYRTGKWYTGPK